MERRKGEGLAICSKPFPKVAYMERKNQMFFGSRHGYIKKTTFFFFFGCGHRQAVGEEPISNVIQDDSLELQSFTP